MRVCTLNQHYCVIQRIQVCQVNMSANVVRRLGLSVGRQLLIGARGRSLVGAVSTRFPQAPDRSWFSSDSQPKYSKEYFDGVRLVVFICFTLFLTSHCDILCSWWKTSLLFCSWRETPHNQWCIMDWLVIKKNLSYFFFPFTVWIQSSSGADSKDAWSVMAWLVYRPMIDFLPY